MIKEYSLLSGNSFIIAEGKIEEQKGDVLLNWTYPMLNAGPGDAFSRIIRKAGAQVVSSTILMNDKVKPGDVFSSIAGLLDFYLVAHAVYLPNQKPDVLNNIAFNLTNTLLTYRKASNICRNVYLTCPDIINPDALINSILLYEGRMDGDFTFYFMMETEDQYAILIKLLDDKLKKGKNSLWLFIKPLMKLLGLTKE